MKIKGGVIWVLLFGFSLIHILALLCYPMIDVDSAKYASISMEMLQIGSYLEVYDRLIDYLDKPPMLFWVSSIFLMVFGLKCWAYKLGSYVFLIAASLYFKSFLTNKTNATIANHWLLLWTSSIGFSYLMLDIKTEPLLLTGLLIGYPSLVGFIQKANYQNTVIAAIGDEVTKLTEKIFRVSAGTRCWLRWFGVDGTEESWTQ